ncbi:MAG: hypothetical protein ACTSX9_07515 [Candidatus Njordarchaeales archaeon]
MSEDVEFIISEELEETYRPSRPIQVLIYVILTLIISLVMYQLVINEMLDIELAVTTLLFSLAFLFPIIIKFRTTLIEVIKYGLFGATILSIVYLLVTRVTISSIYDLSLLVIFSEVLFIELLHHISWRFRARRSKTLLVLDAVLAAIFFVSVFMFLQFLGLVIGGILSLFITIVFFYAILPERPL